MGALSGEPGRRPAVVSPSSSSVTPGHDPVRVAQELVDGPGGDRGVEAPFLDGGAHHHGAVEARDEVDRRALHDGAHGPGHDRGARGAGRRRRICPFTGRTGGAAPGGQPVEPARPASRRPRRRRRRRSVVPSSQAHPRHRAAGALDAADPGRGGRRRPAAAAASSSAPTSRRLST